MQHGECLDLLPLSGPWLQCSFIQYPNRFYIGDLCYTPKINIPIQRALIER